MLVFVQYYIKSYSLIAASGLGLVSFCRVLKWQFAFWWYFSIDLNQRKTQTCDIYVIKHKVKSSDQRSEIIFTIPFIYIFKKAVQIWILNVFAPAGLGVSAISYRDTVRLGVYVDKTTMTNPRAIINRCVETITKLERRTTTNNNMWQPYGDHGGAPRGFGGSW